MPPKKGKKGKKEKAVSIIRVDALLRIIRDY